MSKSQDKRLAVQRGVERYSPVCTGFEQVWLEEDNDGDAVMLTDYDTLEAELEKYETGYKGSCLCCEPVGIKNVELAAENATLRSVVESTEVVAKANIALARQSCVAQEHKLGDLEAENKRLRGKVAYYIGEARYQAAWHRASVQEFYEYRVTRHQAGDGYRGFWC